MLHIARGGWRRTLATGAVAKGWKSRQQASPQPVWFDLNAKLEGLRPSDNAVLDRYTNTHASSRINALMKQERYKECVEKFLKASQWGIRIDRNSCALALYSYYKMNPNRPDLVVDFAVKNIAPWWRIDAKCHAVFLEACCSAGLLENAVQSFKLLVSTKYVTRDNLKVLVEALVKAGRLEDASHALNMCFDIDVVLDVNAFNAILDTLTRNSSIDEAMRFLERAVRFGVVPNEETLNLVLEGFCAKGSLEFAQSTYDNMLAEGFLPNRKCFLNLISLCMKNRNNDLLFRIREDMEKLRVPFETEMLDVFVIQYAKLRRHVDAAALIQRCGDDVVTSQHVLAVIDGLFEEKRIDDAVAFALSFEGRRKELHFKALQGLMFAHCKARNFDEFEHVLLNLKSKNFRVSVAGISSIIDHFVNVDDVDSALRVVGSLRKLGISVEDQIMNHLVSKMWRGQDLSQLLEKFSLDYGFTPSDSCFEALANVLTEKESVQESEIDYLMKMMEIYGCLQHPRTLGALVSSYCKHGFVHRGMELFLESRKVSALSNVGISALVKSASEIGKEEDLEVLASTLGSCLDNVNSVLLFNGLVRVGMLPTALKFLKKAAQKKMDLFAIPVESVVDCLVKHGTTQDIDLFLRVPGLPRLQEPMVLSLLKANRVADTNRILEKFKVRGSIVRDITDSREQERIASILVKKPVVDSASLDALISVLMDQMRFSEVARLWKENSRVVPLVSTLRNVLKVARSRRDFSQMFAVFQQCANNKTSLHDDDYFAVLDLLFKSTPFKSSDVNNFLQCFWETRPKCITRICETSVLKLIENDCLDDAVRWFMKFFVEGKIDAKIGKTLVERLRAGGNTTDVQVLESVLKVRDGERPSSTSAFEILLGNSLIFPKSQSNKMAPEK
eukprot:TRINITY_DN10196_c0_g3_i1.p1 TRINITY_DN10196_c0_g3~~TRINITY_DN10196_c0_g3_i1.p1  ORF type:complete len:900 (-),score=211.31 TRINITY_DN10196_c0_g3_i1:39-2738(-)